MEGRTVLPTLSSRHKCASAEDRYEVEVRGEQFLILLQQTGLIGAGLAALGFITAATVAVLGLRALASSSRSRA
jgi:hypothetical protein